MKCEDLRRGTSERIRAVGMADLTRNKARSVEFTIEIR